MMIPMKKAITAIAAKIGMSPSANLGSAPFCAVNQKKKVPTTQITDTMKALAEFGRFSNKLAFLCEQKTNVAIFDTFVKQIAPALLPFTR